jgi:hypothetical protein
VLYNPPPPSKLAAIGERHRCRNSRCGAKLKPPTTNRLDAFCCSGCFESFYRSRCLVCEQLFSRKTERRLLCGRAKCKREFQRHPERFSVGRYIGSVLVPNGTRSAHSTGLKIGQKGDRPFCLVAGPKLSPTAFRLATLPLDPDLAARVARANAPYFEALTKSKRAATRKALIKRHHPPVNVLGGYCFPGAPVVDLSPIDTPEWAAPSQWRSTGWGVCPPIPDFLLRKPIPAAIPTAVVVEPTPCPVPAPVHVGEEEKSCA